MLFALLAINGNSPDIRVLAVSPKREYLKDFLSKKDSYWWADTGRVIETPKLTWRIKQATAYEYGDMTEEALFHGQLLGKPVTKLIIKVVEMGYAKT